MDGRVTILLSLKGRENFNARWIDYHARVGLPWPVIVADGEPNDANRSLWRNVSGLDISYLEFNDGSLLDFYRKLRDLTAAARTPYVMLTDNDDFVVSGGVSASADFLDGNPDHVSAGGLVLGMIVTGRSLSVTDDIVTGGYLSGLRPIYPAISYDDATATARVLHCIRNYVPTWYALHRRDVLLEIFEALVDSRIEDVAAMELFVATTLAARGRQRQATSEVNYIRQLNSSSVGAHVADTVSRMLEGNLVRDIRTLAEKLADVLALQGSPDRHATVAMLLRELTAYQRLQLQPVRPSDRRRQFIRRYTHTARAKLPFVHSAGTAIEIASVRRALRRQAASSAMMTSFNRAMAALRSAITPRAALA